MDTRALTSRMMRQSARPAILLRARPRVDGHRLRAGALARFGDLRRVDARLVPAGADFDRDRQPRGGGRRRNHARDLFRLAHHGAALAVSGDLRRGAAEVQVDERKAERLQLRRRAGDELRLAAEQLKPADSLARQAREQLDGVAVLAARIDPALRGEHLADRPRRALLKAEQAHRRVGHAGHRREARAAGQSDFADFHASGSSAPRERFSAIRRTKSRARRHSSSEKPANISS